MKLNLASGQRPFKEPWINVDIKDQGYKVDLIADIKDMPTIKDESVDIAILHHVVEHIPIHEMNAYITEWQRILKKDGRLSVFVPNLRAIDKAWLEGQISTYIHNVNTFGAYQTGVEDLHKWGYDKEELISRMCGEDNVGNKAFTWSAIKDLDPLSCRHNYLYDGADMAFDWWILAVEFVK